MLSSSAERIVSAAARIFRPAQRQSTAEDRTVDTGKRLRRITVTLAVASMAGAWASTLLGPPAARAAGYLTMIGCQNGSSTAWRTTSNGGSFGLQLNCPPGNLTSYPMGLSLGGGTAASGQYATWYTAVPSGMQITRASVVTYFARNLTAGQWAGDWTFGAAGHQSLANTIGAPGSLGSAIFGVSPTGPPATLFGWSIQCRASSGCSNNGDLIQVGNVSVTALETQGPTISPSGLWDASGYVWGRWPVVASANGPSGVCNFWATYGGHVVASMVNQRDQSVWDQCGSAVVNQTVDTADPSYGQGAVQLTFNDSDAAGQMGPVQKTVYVDNIRPGMSLSGPTDVSSAAGTQYITATATAGASGVRGISCSIDGAPAQWHANSSWQIPFVSLGVHYVRCVSENNSYSANGQPNSSAPATWMLSIRQPSVSTASFSALKGLQCSRVRTRERIRAHWVTIRKHGKLVSVRRRARIVVRRVVRCHARVVVKRICHVGHCIKQRIVVPPYTAQESTDRVRFGKGATVSGWLGTPSGYPLSGQQVQIMTAPDNGSNAFSQAAVVTTGPYGTWSAGLPPGPSRLVEAVYGGASTIEPATSGQIHLVVPAKVRLIVRPRRVRWGRTIRIAGRVLGGYIPAGKLLRLRIGVSGLRETVGIPNIDPSGRFHTTWTFASGNGVVRYWFSVSTLNEADYAYAPGSSRRVYVTVGPR